MCRIIYNSAISPPSTQIQAWSIASSSSSHRSRLTSEVATTRAPLLSPTRAIRISRREMPIIKSLERVCHRAECQLQRPGTKTSSYSTIWITGLRRTGQHSMELPPKLNSKWWTLTRKMTNQSSDSAFSRCKRTLTELHAFSRTIKRGKARSPKSGVCRLPVYQPTAALKLTTLH